MKSNIEGPENLVGGAKQPLEFVKPRIWAPDCIVGVVKQTLGPIICPPSVAKWPVAGQ